MHKLDLMEVVAYIAVALGGCMERRPAANASVGKEA
jgi:PBP1b-binding outer membrane lipoprotein LpoB